MDTPSTPVEPRAGQIWAHAEHDYTVVTTRVTDNHVHYRINSEEPTQHAQAAKEYLEDEFGYSLAYIAPSKGSCADPDVFAQTFEYQTDRPLESYESHGNTDDPTSDPTDSDTSVTDSESNTPSGP